ncbi:MAG TPA: hypothetical protein VM900_13660 [Sphingomonas sp.]|jgi:hypothetical protein|nr:hypothetical protein [Sphingomonas sp.]
MTEDAERSTKPPTHDEAIASQLPDSELATGTTRDDELVPRLADGEEASAHHNGAAGESLSWAIRRSRELIQESQRILADSRREAPSRRWTTSD